MRTQKRRHFETKGSDMSDKKSVGLIGVGLMGKGIGKTLMEKGYPLSVVANKNRTHVETLVGLGASEAGSIAELAGAVDVIITCLPNIPSVHAVFEGPGGVLENAKSGTLIIDTTTGDPELTKKLEADARAKGILLAEAPLLGGPKMTWEGTISLAVGGADDALAAAMPILEDFSKARFVAGGPGAGHTLKLINNAVTLTNSAVLYEAFAVARTKGVDLETLYGALDASMASSKRLHAIAPNLINNDHTVTFALDTATKDLVLFSMVANQTGVPTLVADSSRALYQLCQSLGYGDKNVTEIAEALAQLGGATFGDET